ncbi:MAG: dTDP-4-dehydrorhamnose 3,5-epimerase [Fimbriimonadaceae bacterium]|nr:dTDP-4-dehydrorhamnose 3,5-epimerase [Fimbriimonadaceae bacterium]
MKILNTTLPDVILAELTAHQDARGIFKELYRGSGPYTTDHGLSFSQDNFSSSNKGVLRGMHVQTPNLQGKLVSCLHGAIFDVVVDVRPESATFGRSESFLLTGENHRQLYVPEGFLHGFLALEGPSLVHYKTTREFEPVGDRTVHWADPELGIEWPTEGLDLIISAKDEAGMSFADFRREIGA